MENGVFYNYIEKEFDFEIKYEIDKNIIYNNIRKLLTEAVDKRMMSDRKVCTLLSGGLDSTLITALVNKYYNPYELNTYAIGLKNSTDLYYAKKASEYLKTNHYEIIVNEEEFLNAIEKTIYQIESFCVTTVRASVGNYLISLYIRNKGNHSKDKEYIFDEDSDIVVFCGDVSDELFGSYRGFELAKNSEEFFQENIKMLKNIHYFDVLRSDKCISGASLEARVPFADKKFVKYIMSLDPNLKMFNSQKIEKYILRKAFSDTDLLSDELLWRRKEAFSDGVSSNEKSWFEIIKNYVDKLIPDEEFNLRCEKFNYMKPYDKESLWYREIFEKYFPNKANMIPYYWKQPFTNQLDPSARLLKNY
jgi:asparagine synthase (glutamine-hydrolysing)